MLVTARTKPDSALLATARDAANVRSFTLLEGLRDGTGLLFTLGKRPLALPGEASSRRRSFTFSPLRPPQALTLTLTLTLTITITLTLALALPLPLTLARPGRSAACTRRKRSISPASPKLRWTHLEVERHRIVSKLSPRLPRLAFKGWGWGKG